MADAPNKIEKLRHLLGDVDVDDSVLETYLEIAGLKIVARAYPFANTSEKSVPQKYEYLQLEMAALMFNKRGAEGAISYTESGIVSISYGDADIPSSMLNAIVPYCGSLSE